MPYKSKAQESFFNIHRKELEKKGVNVDEWNKSSKGLPLPNHVSKYKEYINSLAKGRQNEPKRKKSQR